MSRNHVAPSTNESSIQVSRFTVATAMDATRQSARLAFAPRPPTVILMAGLQGSGKTTATAKLARFLMNEHGSSVGVAACDVYRPAAVDQLVKVGGQVGATVYEQGTDKDPVDI